MKITIIQHTDGYSVDLKSMIADIDRLEAQNARYRETLQTIIDEYNKPPYTEFDWIAWKQKAEKALRGE